MFPVMLVDVPLPDTESDCAVRFEDTLRFPAIVDVPVPCTVRRPDAVMAVRVCAPVTVMLSGISESLRLKELFDP